MATLLKSFPLSQRADAHIEQAALRAAEGEGSTIECREDSNRDVVEIWSGPGAADEPNEAAPDVPVS